MTLFKQYILLSALILFFVGCEEKSESRYNLTYSNKSPISQEVYIFGVHPLHNPKRLFEVYQPLVNYINKNVKGYKLRLEASRNYSAYNKKLFNGYFDFSLPNPYQTIVSLNHGYKVFGKMADDENFRGIILVRKDSNISSVDDIKGKSVSYPAPTALAATMMPQLFLYEHGVDINRDITNEYVGSQESSIMNVYLKKSIAAATWPPPWEAFIKLRPQVAKEVEIKWQTKPLVNNGLVVKSNIAKNVVDDVSKILFTLHEYKEGREILKQMKLTSFESANNSTYEPVEEFLKEFEKDVRPIRKNQ
ncbi:MAG: phosphate/phosphite/phosphonate ABC transporter substrate-binding protein [Campylobacterota bacterium]|nr:phosphate/phosphite/phosphonate ABC transporter substrate-binding protein [Campylobacterota bacterium]